MSPAGTFSANGSIGKGQPRHGPGGHGLLDLNGGHAEDAWGFRFGEERFVVGEYVSLTLPSSSQHAYVVARFAEL